MDGKPMFDLSQLLEYCNGEREFIENTLKRINDKFIRVSVKIQFGACGPISCHLPSLVYYEYN